MTKNSDKNISLVPDVIYHMDTLSDLSKDWGRGIFTLKHNKPLDEASLRYIIMLYNVIYNVSYNGDGSMPRIVCNVCNHKFYQEIDETICSYCMERKTTCLLCQEVWYNSYLKHEEIICSKCSSSFRLKNANPWTILRFATFVKDSFTCRYCGKTPFEDKIKLHCDHILPKSKGGQDELDNLITACVDCNLGKLDVLLPQALDYRVRRRTVNELASRIKELRDQQMENSENDWRKLADDSYVGEGDIQTK